jgi:hypothetical protein
MQPFGVVDSNCNGRLIPTTAATPPVVAHHQVGNAGRALLTQNAEEIGLPQPATMLLGETQFEAAVANAGEEIEYSRRQSATIGVLRRILFT